MENREQVESPPDAGPDSPGQAAEQLWQRWRQKQGPTLQEVLAHAGELSAAKLALALGAEQHQHWQEGKRTPAEVYLQQYPVLSTDEEAACDLVYGEFLLRQELAEAPSLQEYLERFPQLADALKQLHEYAQFNSVLHWLPLESATEPNDPGNQTEPAIAPGVVIAGRYTLVEEIGAGGMGEVWVAEQTAPVKRKVALKLIKAGMDSKRVLARFEAERQALALMEHPNIAKVHDGGITPGGHPFFVMELVNGLPLTNFCDDARLTLQQRLELFVPICQAVQHAHQKGIVHRDLKPSNILITLCDGKAAPKVIDFGVAKAVAGKLTDESLSTQLGAVVGTLDYMAPEQAALSAIDIDTRADIYSLGVILYELLTGLRPFDAKRLRRAALDELFRIIREEEPPKPSARVSADEALPTLAALRQTEPKRLVALMRGELDCIVMKALEKDRRRRYETANGLARDIQRYLADEPVEAQPASMHYRLGKFFRRNKAPVLATSAVLFMLLCGLVAGTAGIIWHQNEEAKRATAVVVRQALAEQAIGAAVDQAEKSRAELGQILSRPGGVFGLLNEPDRWQARIELAQEGVKHAKDLVANADAPIAPDLNKRIQHLETLLGQHEADRQLALRLEKIRTDRAAWNEGKFDDASAGREYPRAFAEAKLTVLEGDANAIAKQIASSAIKEQLVAALDDWAFVDVIVGKKDLMERLLEVARLANPDPRFGDQLRQLKVWKDRKALTSLANETPPANLSPQLLAAMGGLLRGNNVDREAWLRNAQIQYPADFWLNFILANAIRETKPVEAEGFFRAAVAVRPGSVVPYNNLGALLRRQKRPADAAVVLHKAIHVDPKNAAAHYNLGAVYSDQKRPAEAIASFQRAIDLDPRFARAYDGLGIALSGQKRMAKAIEAYNTAIHLDPNYAPAYYNLGNALHKLKRSAAAIDAFKTAIVIDPKDAMAFNGLGVVYADLERPADAITAFKEAIDLDPKYAMAYYNLGDVLREHKRPTEAIAAFEKAIDLDPKFFQAYNNLGNVLRDQKRLAEAIAAFQKVIELEPNFAKAHSNLGTVLAGQKRLAEASKAFQDAIDLDSKDAMAYYNLGLALREQGSFTKAAAASQKAVDLLPPGHPRRDFAQRHKKQSQELVALEVRLPLVLEKKESAGAEELLALAQMCQQFKKHYASAARLYQKAFQADPRLARDLGKQDRYNAACAAALAASRQGEETARLNKDEKSNLRRQALDWLQADMDLYAKHLKAGKVGAVMAVIQRLDHWQQDDDLAGVRDVKELVKLPGEENQAWLKLWTGVHQLHEDAQSRFSETRLEGILSAEETSNVREVKMTAGKTYVIDMESKAFDTFLKLQDAKGKLLAENDDISPTNQNSRIRYTAPADGVYRIVATSFEQAGTGPYTLRIREFKDAK
jgi:serine/threonine protein kinase/Tfp pilus assembly protein PilF